MPTAWGVMFGASRRREAANASWVCRIRPSGVPAALAASRRTGIPFTPARHPGNLPGMDNFPMPVGLHGRLPFDEVLFGDTETTGLAPYGTLEGIPTGDPLGPDRLCSVAFLRLRRSAVGWRPTGSIAFVCDPGRPVPEHAARVNGFHWSGDGSQVPPGRTDLAGAGRFASHAALLLQFLGNAPLCFHNAVFDVAVLDAEFERAGLPRIAVPVLCTKKAFSEKRGFGRPHRYLPGTNLNALCDLLGVDRSERIGPDGSELHGAAADASMGAACFALLEPSGWMLAEDPEVLPHRVRTLAAQPAIRRGGAADNAQGAAHGPLLPRELLHRK